MSTLEEAMLMAEGGSEENPYIVINNDLRTITPPTSTLLLGVYNDKEVLKVPFKMPRYYDDIDLSRFSIQINYINAMRIPNFDEADDIVVEDDHITFNWTTKRSVFLKDGTVQFSVCLRLADIDGNVSKEFNTTIGYGIVLEGIEADADSDDPEAYSVIAHMIQIKNYVDGKSDAVTEAIDTAIDTITAKQSRVEELVEEASEAIDETRSMVSYPNVAETAAAMSDQTKIYVYTGSETDYNTGHWYYYKTGSGWTDGGLYMSQGVNTDTTLTFPDTPADAKATGIVLSKKADYDGSYRELTSGDTYQIMSKKTVSDSGLMYPRKVETLFPNRTLGGKAFRDKLIGGSIVWKQLIQNGNFESTTDWASNGSGYIKEMSASNNILHVVVGPNAVGNNSTYLRKNSFATLKTNHKYIATIDVKPSRNTAVRFLYPIGAENTRSIEAAADTWLTTSWVVSLKNDLSYCYFYFNVKNAVQEDDTIDFKNAMLIDLTQMFGSTIADYIYDLEQNSEGAGVAYFRKYFPNDYYEYNPGEIISVTPGKFESVGFNIWDEEWEVGVIVSATGANANGTNRIRSKNHIPIIPETTYYLKSISTSTTLLFSLYYYDSNKVYLGSDYEKRVLNNTFVTPANARYMRFNTYAGYGSIYNHDICINLSDPDKNGTYEPYEHHSYPLDSTLTLRGIPKLDESNNLYFDGDTYEDDGTVIRRYGIVDLGTLGWTYLGNETYPRFYSSSLENTALKPMPVMSNRETAKIICIKYEANNVDNQYLGHGESSIGINMAGRIYVRDAAYTDAAAFKEAMSGVYLLYELATPTVETLNPVSSPQSIALTGIEELTDREYEAGNRDVFLPAWHESRYTLDVVGEIAFKNSYHDSLGAGVADQLMSKKKLIDTESYTFRKTGGNLTGIGNRVYDEIVGGTVCWNQMSYGMTPNECIVATEDGIDTITPSSNSNRYVSLSNKSSKYTVLYTNHVYLQTVIIKSNGTDYVGFQNYLSSKGFKKTNSASFVRLTEIFKQTTDASAVIQLYSTDLTVYSIKSNSFMFFDLTQMFGSTIADYIYALEQQTEGAGVAYFRKYFPNDYYEYNPSELMSVSNLISHDTVGFNIWDEEWELGTFDNSGEPISSSNNIRSKNLIPVIPNTAYFINQPNWSVVSLRDADMNVVGRLTTYSASGNGYLLNIPSGVYYIGFSMSTTYGTTYNHDICINLSDPDKNGTYEPYVKHSYPLDSTLTLRGIPKLDESNNLYYDGDTYTPEGTVVRKYDIVDLGTLTWDYNSNYSYFYATLSTMKTATLRLKCAKYETASMNGQANISDKQMTTGTGYNIVVIRDSSYTDAAAFKEAMSGVMLVYELATPTIESAEPYQSPQVVDGGGTEEYVTNNPVKIPVGHNSSYGLDLGGKLETIVDTPSVDGTYTLKVTVTNGVPVFSWS